MIIVEKAFFTSVTQLPKHSLSIFESSATSLYSSKYLSGAELLRLNRGLRIVGNATAGIGMFLSAIDLRNGDISNVEFAADGLATAAGFTGPWGWVVSAGYFTGGKAIIYHEKNLSAIDKAIKSNNKRIAALQSLNARRGESDERNRRIDNYRAINQELHRIQNQE